jgi:hypothetical protein
MAGTYDVKIIIALFLIECEQKKAAAFNGTESPLQPRLFICAILLFCALLLQVLRNLFIIIGLAFSVEILGRSQRAYAVV